MVIRKGSVFVIVTKKRKPYHKELDFVQLGLNPKNFSASNNLGISYKKLKNYTKAEEYLQRSIELNSEYVNALVNLGNLKNETYFFDNAILDFDRECDLYLW